MNLSKLTDPVASRPVYQSDSWRNRCVRWDKYLLPYGAFWPFDRREAAPKNFTHLKDVAVPVSLPNLNSDDLRERDEVVSHDNVFAPAQISSVFVYGSSGLLPGTVDCIRNGEKSHRELPGVELAANHIYAIPNGGVVGRNGCLLDNQGNAIFESAFLYKPGMSESERYRNFDPRHWKHLRRGNLTQRFSLPAAQRLVGTALSVNNCSSHNFYHWLTEVAPRVFAAKQAGVKFDYVIVDHQASYQKEILLKLGTKPEQWVQPHCALHLKCDQLLWCNEPGVQLLKSFSSAIRQALSQDPIWTEKESQCEASGYTKLYISRHSARHRKLRQESEISDRLVGLGFKIVDFDKISFDKQLSLVSRATHVVAVHGAALAHTIFANRGTKIVEIVPSKRNNYHLYPNQSRMFGHRHVLIESETSRHGQWLDCSIRDVELALAELG